MQILPKPKYNITRNYRIVFGAAFSSNTVANQQWEWTPGLTTNIHTRIDKDILSKTLRKANNSNYRHISKRISTTEFTTLQSILINAS